MYINSNNQKKIFIYYIKFYFTLNISKIFTTPAYTEVNLLTPFIDIIMFLFSAYEKK